MTMPNLNVYQVFLIIVSVLSAFSGLTAQLTDLFGASTAHLIVTGASVLTTIITAVMAPMVGNASMVKSVAALPGVTRVMVNTQAAPAVAAVAVDPAQAKVGAANPADQAALASIAKG
jgi:hypothetical protein